MDKEDLKKYNLENQKTLEIRLWGKLKKGDITALGDLYDQYIDILFSYGMQLTNNKNHVMNCIHDLFLDLYKYKSKLAKIDNVKYYLFKSLKRKIFKKVNTKLVLTKDNYLIENSSEKGIYSKSFEEVLIASEQVSERSIKLAEALNFLTERQKQALFLRFTEDRPYEEIAELLNVSVQTSRTTIYRAIKVLRNRLISLVFSVVFLFF
ncbi:MAG: sigma-70 family RNA polymerase sigma factor [Lutibacter sp.]|uniref:RNA polymerase sigma factor n=1 Tax=Lutibacter sp. TaxID=1925666 RepID=UPI00385CC888